jgi:hypothetical protein
LCNARWLRLEAAIVDEHKVGVGVVANFIHPNKLTMTVIVTVTVTVTWVFVCICMYHMCVCVFTCAEYAIMYACLHDSACIMCMSIHTCMYSVCITCVCEPFIYTGILYVSSVCAPCMCVWAC